MMTRDPLDEQLRATLRAALDEASGPHPSWTDAPARHAVERRTGRKGTRRAPFRVLAVAALLAIGGGTAVLVGSRPPDRGLVFAPPGPIPESLVGEWLTDELPLGPPLLVLDLGAPPGLVSDEYGEVPIRRATGYVPLDGDRGVLILAATSQCPEARYLASGVSEGQLRLEPLMNGCPESGTLTGRAWTEHRVTMPRIPVAGARQGSLAFTEPFHFPVVPPPDEIPVFLGQDAELGYLSMGNTFWRGWFLDDVGLPRDMSNPAAGELADLPQTAGDLEAWLRANRKLASRAPIELTVDGRTAVRFDSVERPSGAWPEDSLDARVSLGIAHSFYLIPTGSDTIVFLVRADVPEEVDWAQELLKTMTFD